MAKTDEEIALLWGSTLRKNAQELSERAGEAAWGAELTPDQNSKLHGESSATIMQLLEENARLTENIKPGASATFGEEDRIRLTARIGSMALEAFADSLQENSGLLTRDAPGVAEARTFAEALRGRAEL